jgi:hypothetical protein
MSGRDAGSGQTPASHRFAKLFERGEVSSDRLALGQLRGAIASFGIEKIEQARGAATVRVLADVAVLLRHVEVAGSKVPGHPVAGLKRLVRIANAGQNLPPRRSLLLIRLSDGVARARDLALVAGAGLALPGFRRWVRSR